MLLLMLHHCCTARISFEFQGNSAGWNRPACRVHGTPKEAHTNNHDSTVHSCAMKENFEARLLLTAYSSGVMPA